MPDTHEEIFQFILDHPNDFQPKDINGFVNWLHRNPEKWQRTKQWALAKTRAAHPEESRKQIATPADDTDQLHETARRMKAMYAAGSSVQEIIDTIPCWVDDSGWSYDSVERIVTGQQPRWHQMVKTFGLWPGVKAA